MVNFKNVRAIEFVANFEGVGCVNFDSKSQRYFLNATGLGCDATMNDNVLLAKKIFKNVVDEDGKNKSLFKYKVSSECIRHAMYEDVMPFQNPSISSIPTIFYNALAMPCFLTRGYMFTPQDSNTLRKKSVVTVCDAFENGEWRNKLTFDFHTRSGQKDVSKKEEGDQKDTTIYNIENVGNLTYASEGYIDLTELQFIPGDPAYDRMGIDADGGVNERIYLEALKRNLPTFNGDFDYYYINNTYCGDEWAERGILLDTNSVNTLVKDILKRIMSVNIVRRNAYLKFKTLKIAVVMDGGNTEKWIEITPSNLNEFNFEYFCKYSMADENKIVANNELVNKIKAELKANKKEKKNKGKSKKNEDVSTNVE